MTVHTAYLSIGSNHQAAINLQQAINLLAEKTTLIAVSSVYETAPIGTKNPASYFNAVAIIQTELEAIELKAKVLRPIEVQMGREWAEGIMSVPIDLDISLFNDAVMQLGKHQIPDPDILTRAYVAIPLADIAPDYVHPTEKRTLSEISSKFRDERGIEKREDIILTFE